MCGRYCIAASPGEIHERYQVITPELYTPRFNLAPGQKILSITQGSQHYDAHLIDWGIQSGKGHRVINARIETIHEKHLFRDLVLSHRCLIPASGYYEWKHAAGMKIPYYFSSRSESLISFAGLIHPSPTGGEGVILTTQASPPCSDIHDRMPVLLNPPDEQKYLLYGEISPIEERLEMFEVSSRVNRVGVDDPGLVKPSKPGSQQVLQFDDE
ncbi:MAG TPA: SOS response-associated peptidase [Methanospirillum sp.]|nr:SOS response-associated peptidase [Methanospirillum sp.]